MELVGYPHQYLYSPEVNEDGYLWENIKDRNRNYMEERAEILLVDDHTLILEGMYRILDRIPEVKVADAVTSGREAMALVEKKDYDIYILDVSLPDMSGMELIGRVREINKNACIIVNTLHEEIWTINKLISLKVNAVVLKSSEAIEMENAVKAVLRGDSYMCPRFRSIRLKLDGESARTCPRDMPTKREMEVLQAIAKGDSTHEIAAKLQISENTVETFRKRLIQKFCAKNAIDLVVKAMTKGVIGIE